MVAFFIFLNSFPSKHIELVLTRTLLGNSSDLDELALSVLNFVNAEKLSLIFYEFALERIKRHHFPPCIHKKIIFIILVVHGEEFSHKIRNFHFRKHIVLMGGTIFLNSLHKNGHHLQAHPLHICQVKNISVLYIYFLSVIRNLIPIKE